MIFVDSEWRVPVILGVGCGPKSDDILTVGIEVECRPKGSVDFDVLVAMRRRDWRTEADKH
jgi:hypothetical protein